MRIVQAINNELSRLGLPGLSAEQVRCLREAADVQGAAVMLRDLRDRSGLRLPLPEGTHLGGPFSDAQDAVLLASGRAASFPVVAVDEMATDQSRGSGEGNEFYVTGFAGGEAAVALADESKWVACWVKGAALNPEAREPGL